LSRTRVPLFVNPKAGLGAIGIESLAQELGSDAVVPEAVEPERLADRLRRAVAEGCDVVAVAGGDGSLHTAVNALAGTDTTLAIVPTGTLNNFARRLGIPDVAAARKALHEGQPDDITLAAVGDELFLNTLTFGEYARTVRRREQLRPYLTKWPAAFLGFLEVVLTLRTFAVELEVEGERVQRRTPFVWVGIGIGSFPSVAEAIERRSSPDLEVAVLHARSPWAMAAFMWRASVQMIREEYPVRDRELEIFHARDLTLHTKRPLDGTSDGELVRPMSPVRICVRDHAVKVLRV
jgi:diacylglycerol kinase family enzyme